MCKRKEKKQKQRNVVMDNHIKESREGEKETEEIRREICVYMIWK